MTENTLFIEGWGRFQKIALECVCEVYIARTRFKITVAPTKRGWNSVYGHLPLLSSPYGEKT